MPKRFTDTNKYKDPWFRKLEPKLKVLFLFMCDDCDHAGVWKENFQTFNMLFGFNASASDMVGFGDKILMLNEETYLIRSFIKYQYGPLNPDNKAHLGVIRALSYAGVDYAGYIKKGKDLQRSTGIGIGIGEGTGIGIGTGVGTDAPAPTITSKEIPF